MKLIILVFLLSLCSPLFSQNSDSTIVVNDSSISVVSTDTIRPPLSAAGNLMDDDPAYNKKYPWYIPSARVLSANVFNWAIARYVYKFDWAVVGPEDWKRNFKLGPEWDTDGFGINFIGHPHTGNYYHNIARSNGYSFWQSLPFAIQGSVVWEYFGENTRPSYNDLINTPLSGMFIGEVLYRLSSNVLDDRTRGKERVLREIFAGILNPPRFLNRWTQGKLKRVTPVEVYQQEPLNITLNAGAHRINNTDNFGTGATNAIVNVQLDYGDPFEVRRRKPFDIFRFRAEMSYGSERKLLENVNGYGLLAGKTFKKDRLLGGIFQHFDYWNNNVFEIGSLGYGGALISKIPLTERSNIFSNIHLAIVPLAGNNSKFGPDTSSFRTYNFGGGLQGKVEEMLNLNKWASIGFTAYGFYIHTYNGQPGNSLVTIFRPTVAVKLFKNLSLGFEHHIYKNDRWVNDVPDLHVTRTEQKLYLQFFFEGRNRDDKYH